MRMTFGLLIPLLLVSLTGCSTQGQNQTPRVTTGQTSGASDQSVPPPQAKTFPLDVCTTMGKMACQFMSKMYPEQAPTCSAYREANGRLVETCGYPTLPNTPPSASSPSPP